MSEKNLRAMLKLANDEDRAEGLRAYARYHEVMCGLSDKYGVPLDRVVAVFVSLSPNSDYVGNLRSTVSVLAGAVNGDGVQQVQVSTYRHCLLRAWAYVQGDARFLERTKGPKVRAFYHNVLNPLDYRHVTIDGHMTAIWRGQDLTMRQALVYNRKEYDEISNACKSLAFENYLVPCELQAILWHTRKRVKRIKYDAQPNLWPIDDPQMLEPYPRRLGPECPIQPSPRISGLRRRPGADLGSGRRGGLSSLHQTSLALEEEQAPEGRKLLR